MLNQCFFINADDIQDWTAEVHVFMLSSTSALGSPDTSTSSNGRGGKALPTCPSLR